MLHIPTIYISTSEEKGRGVYLSESIEADNLIEICPLIVVAKDQVPLIHKTILHDYYFLYDEKTETACIPLGYGCLYNHSPQPNARVAFDYEDDSLHIISTTSISAGDEVLIDYTAGEDRALWFDTK